MSVRLLTGYFEDVDSYALQDFETLPVAPSPGNIIDESQLGLGVLVNGDMVWGDAHLDQV